MSMGFGLGQGMALGAFTPLANNPTANNPAPPLEDAIITQDNKFIVTQSGDFLVTKQ